MNDFGTVFRRTIGIDNKGFLIRMFPVVSYRPMRQPYEYIKRGHICVLPLDVRDPEQMMREVYKLDISLITRIMALFSSEPLAQYAGLTEEEYGKLKMGTLREIRRAMDYGVDRVWQQNKGKTVATDDGIILPLLYTVVKPKLRTEDDYAEDFCFSSHAIGPKWSNLVDYCKDFVKEHSIDFNIAQNTLTSYLGMSDECFPDTLRAPGQRWSSIAHCPGMVPMLDSTGQDLSERWGWFSRNHEKMVEETNASRTHSSHKTTFTIYF